MKAKKTPAKKRKRAVKPIPEKKLRPAKPRPKKPAKRKPAMKRARGAKRPVKKTIASRFSEAAQYRWLVERAQVAEKKVLLLEEGVHPSRIRADGSEGVFGSRLRNAENTGDLYDRLRRARDRGRLDQEARRVASEEGVQIGEVYTLLMSP